MIRSAGTIERACELVRAALTWGHDVHVTVTRSTKAARYTVSIVPRPSAGTAGPDPAGDE